MNVVIVYCLSVLMHESTVTIALELSDQLSDTMYNQTH